MPWFGLLAHAVEVEDEGRVEIRIVPDGRPVVLVPARGAAGLGGTALRDRLPHRGASVSAHAGTAGRRDSEASVPDRRIQGYAPSRAERCAPALRSDPSLLVGRRGEAAVDCPACREDRVLAERRMGLSRGYRVREDLRAAYRCARSDAEASARDPSFDGTGRRPGVWRGVQVEAGLERCRLAAGWLDRERADHDRGGSDAFADTGTTRAAKTASPATPSCRAGCSASRRAK